MSILKVDKLGAVFFQNSWRFPTRWYLKIEIFLKYFFGQKITNVAIVIHKYSQFSCRTMYFRSTQLCSRFGRAERQCENSIDYILKELCKLIDCFKLQQIFVAPNFALAHMD